MVLSDHYDASLLPTYQVITEGCPERLPWPSQQRGRPRWRLEQLQAAGARVLKPRYGHAAALHCMLLRSKELSECVQHQLPLPPALCLLAPLA